MWRHFSVAARSIRHFLLYRPFITYMITTGNQIQTKNLLLDPKTFQKILVLVAVWRLFMLLPGQSDIPCFTISNCQSDEYSENQLRCDTQLCWRFFKVLLSSAPLKVSFIDHCSWCMNIFFNELFFNELSKCLQKFYRH